MMQSPLPYSNEELKEFEFISEVYSSTLNRSSVTYAVPSSRMGINSMDQQYHGQWPFYSDMSTWSLADSYYDRD